MHPARKLTAWQYILMILLLIGICNLVILASSSPVALPRASFGQRLQKSTSHFSIISRLKATIVDHLRISVSYMI